MTKDDIDNLGASHFKFIDGSPMYKITNSVINFSTNDTVTKLIINLSDDVKAYIKTLEDTASIIKVEFIKTYVYDSNDNLLQSVYIDYVAYNTYKCIKLI